jgi:hypothetical protein
MVEGEDEGEGDDGIVVVVEWMMHVCEWWNVFVLCELCFINIYNIYNMI